MRGARVEHALARPCNAVVSIERVRKTFGVTRIEPGARFADQRLAPFERRRLAKPERASLEASHDGRDIEGRRQFRRPRSSTGKPPSAWAQLAARLTAAA